MGKRYTYDDGTVIDLDDDVDLESLPEGEGDITDDAFTILRAEAEAREAANAPDDDEVATEPDGVEEH